MTVKIYLTDVCAQCCPESLGDHQPDSKLTGRIKAQVFSQTGVSQRKAAGKRTRIIFLVAAMLSLFATSAFALSRYFMEHEPVQAEGAAGCWTELDESGKILEQQEKFFPDAGMLFSFQGTQERPNIPEFRCFWLPEEADAGTTDSEGWTDYLARVGEDTDMQYIISSMAVPKNGSSLVLNGDVSVIKEEYWGCWYVLQLSSDYTQCKLRWPCEKANYILLFDEQSGFIVTIGGSLDLGVLEKIARNLEIRDSGMPVSGNELDMSIGQIDIGRG